MTTLRNTRPPLRGGETMSTLIEMLANKKKAAAPGPESTVILPVVQRDHEGACGESCSCGKSDEGACCGG